MTEKASRLGLATETAFNSFFITTIPGTCWTNFHTLLQFWALHKLTTA